MMIRKYTSAASLCALIAPFANAATVSVPENGDLILGSMSTSKIYHAKKRSDKAEVFIDVGADGRLFPRRDRAAWVTPSQTSALSMT